MKKILLSIFVLLLTINLQIFSRYYNPDIGRFVSADTVTPGGGADLQGLNRYSYCDNNPIAYVDPSGNESDYFFRFQDPEQNQYPNDVISVSKNAYSLMRVPFLNYLHHGGKWSGKDYFTISRNLSYFAGQSLFFDDYLGGHLSLVLQMYGDFASIPSTIRGTENNAKIAHDFAKVWSKKHAYITRLEMMNRGISIGSQYIDLGLNVWGFGYGTYKTINDIYNGRSWDLITRDILQTGESGAWALSVNMQLVGLMNKKYYEKTGIKWIPKLGSFAAYARVSALVIKYGALIGRLNLAGNLFSLLDLQDSNMELMRKGWQESTVNKYRTSGIPYNTNNIHLKYESADIDNTRVK